MFTFIHHRALLILLLVLGFLWIGHANVNAQSPDRVVHVAPSGHNSASCGSDGQPCRTLQHAVNLAANEEWVKILVAAGVYTRGEEDGSYCDNLQIDAVVCIINRRVEILGGYSTDNWNVADPEGNLTVIDGEDRRRAVMMLNVSRPENTLTMDGFTIRNGRGGGIGSRSGNDAISGFGGGIFVDSAGATFYHMRFEDNLAFGQDRSSDNGGSGVGGGLAVRSAPREVRLEDVVFVNNRAEGGNGVTRGGYAIGGGFYSFRSLVRGSHIVAEGNVSQAGQASGSGVDGNGELSDAQGGGLAFHRDSDVVLSEIRIADNQAIGGPAPNGNAGGAFGGGIFSESAANVVLRNGTVRGNRSQGGNGINDDAPFRGTGFSSGGGMRLSKSPATLDRISVIDNVARGGTGARYRGSPGGGGIALNSYDNRPVTLVNVVVAGNRAEMGGGSDTSVGGGGGGIWFQGVDARIDHTTIADNVLDPPSSLFGVAMTLISRSVPYYEVVLRDSIVARHDIASNSQGIQVKTDTALRFENVLFSQNNGGDLVSGPGNVSGLASTSTVGSIGLVAPGAPDFNYHLSSTSPAVDAAPGSTVSVDRDGESRDSAPDVGAYEADPFWFSVVALSQHSLRVRWTHDPAVSTYQLTVSCPPGASSPAEGGCGQPIYLAAIDRFDLTGLTPYAPYDVSLAAMDDSGSVLNAAATVAAFPTDIFVYLPMAVD